MFRVKILAVVLSIFVTFIDEMAFLKPEISTPPNEGKELKMITPEKIEKVQELPFYPEYPETFTVTATVYYPEKGQTSGNPLITADGSRINPKNPKKHRWIALSRDMLARWGGEIQYGDTVWVRGISDELDGKYIVRDTMNRRFRNRIDILVGRKDKIYGKWENVEIAKSEFPEEVEVDFQPSYYGFAMRD
jgi:3D (Asp-Asp-Asp) domain-containing protein